jgi:hypothetical protein
MKTQVDDILAKSEQEMLSLTNNLQAKSTELDQVKSRYENERH